mmetsp:Transcript_22867/g.62026  ORF Transcript_22867/g.62026 Transcript_22867/m.62026 type:complete len:218 (+) Transcript_22867:96-749(+)
MGACRARRRCPSGALRALWSRSAHVCRGPCAGSRGWREEWRPACSARSGLVGAEGAQAGARRAPARARACGGRGRGLCARGAWRARSGAAVRVFVGWHAQEGQGVARGSAHGSARVCVEGTGSRSWPCPRPRRRLPPSRPRGAAPPARRALPCPRPRVRPLGESSRNSISDVSALAEALKVNKTLKELDLYGNSISDVSALAEALKVNKTLKKLYLR